LDGFETTLNRFDVFGVSASQIRWSGAPGGGPRVRKSDALVFPFTLMWVTFAVFWEIRALDSGAPFFFRLWGVPFILIGLYMLVGRFFWDAYVRANTWYALTDDSALFLRRGFGGGLSTVYVPNISNLSLELQPDGSGTIYFGDASGYQREISASGRSYRTVTPSFRYIADAATVYEKCQAAQRHAATVSQPT
jgi:hypothetical protein